jgi:hypothetical protein
MSDLILAPNFEDADAFYAALTDLMETEGLDGTGLLMRLVLVLANQVGDAQVLSAALAFAAAQ